jgi:eukaryotic-like serine/threonine-protein kinase
VIVSGQALSERFEIRRRLGAGGMGEVYEAFDRERRERVALKTLSHADPTTLTRFKREFRALQNLAHTNLVSLGELVRDGDRWFFTMELVEGRHFLEHVRPRASTSSILGDDHVTFDEERLRDCLGQLVRGLRALHEAGMVHRDVKPSNVMVSRDGRVVLLDFGLVTDADPARQSTDGRAVGTVDYMAPEQAAGVGITSAADWYAVGTMLYEALTGRVPFTGHLLQILINKQQLEPAPPDALVRGLPADLAALCRELLHIEPERRPGGADIAARLGLDDAELRRTSSSAAAPLNDLVGRARELAYLASAWQRAREEPRVVLALGESGIGKSALVRRFARDVAEDDEVITLHGRCYERESVPFKALDGVADGIAQFLVRMPTAEAEALLPGSASLLPRLFPVFQQVDAVASMAPLRDSARDPLEQRRRMFMAFRRLLVALTGRARVLLVIDDLQWADADSFLLLRELLRGAEAPRLLVVATVRGDDATAAMIGERLAGVEALVLPVGPLDDADSRDLAARFAPRIAERVDLDRLLREAGGHPMFLQELMRHVESAGSLAEAPQLDDALWSRIGLLGPDARQLLELVCIAGAPVARDVAMLACRIDGVAFERAASSLRVASLGRELRRGRELALEPYHDRVREAVGRRLDAARQRQLHARLAAALERTEARDPHLLLRHFLLAELPERAARYAEEAAERSLEAHAFDQAAELWQVALDLVPRTADDARRIRLRLGEALIMAGRGAAAAEHYLAAAEGADPATRLECHRHAAEQLLISGRIERGVSTLDTLLAEIDVTVPRTPRRAVAHLLWTRAKLRVRGLGFRERHRREIPDTDLARLEILNVAGQGLAVVDSLRGADFTARHLLEALRTGHRGEIARAMMTEAMFQSTQASIARARRLLARAVEIADPADPYLAGLGVGADGLISYFAGDLEHSIERLSQADGMMRQVPLASWARVTSRIFVMFALRFVGDFRRLRERYDQYMVDAELRGDQYLSSTLRRCCVPMWLAEDDPDAAMGDVSHASWVPETAGFHVQHFHELIAHGEVALYVGAHRDRARIADLTARLDASLLRRVTSIRDQMRYLEGRLALALDDDRADPRGGARRADHLGDQLMRGQRIARVWGLLLRGGAAHRRGDRTAAAAAYAAAAALAAGNMRASAAVAQLRVAELRGDAAAEAAARAELAELGVRNVDRMAQVIAPVG